MIIEIEGNDFVGKTTLCNNIKNVLGGDNYCKIIKLPNILTPGGMWAFKIVNELSISSLTQFMAVVSDFCYTREFHIQFALNDNKVVLLDRGKGSSMVYQDQITTEHKEAIWNIVGYKSDYIYLLDAPVDILMNRKKLRKTQLSSYDLESYAKFRNRRKRYLQWAAKEKEKHNQIMILNATRSISNLTEIIVNQINQNGKLVPKGKI